MRPESWSREGGGKWVREGNFDTPDRVKIACALQDVCYNADTFRNPLFRKWLLVIQARLFRNLRLIYVFAAMAGLALPAVVTAQSAAAPKAPTSTPSLSLPQTTTSKGKAQTDDSAAAERARRAERARARAARAARVLREAQKPKFKAEAGIIYSPDTGQVLWEENSQSQRSIASITKVMTAAVFLEGSPDLSRQVVITRSDVRRASTTYLRTGYKVTTNGLLHLLLIASDNAASRALARVSPYGADGFVDRMNDKARELGLASTRYADTSGLLSDNVSSAYDMARLIAYVSGDERISEIMRKQRHTVAVGRRSITVRSTNQLLRQGDVDVLGGKTGFIRKAGYCLATLLRLPGTGAQVAVVVLGAKSSAGRFRETRHLFNWLSSRAQDLVVGVPLEAAASALTQ
jgi:D-alanyl-D-alanine endopeptidase (penicillin-binding protein 7)